VTARIYVDVQAVQGPFHERGIARYVSDLAAALERAGAPIAAFGLNPTQPAPASLHHNLLASPRLTWNTAANFDALLADGPLIYLMLSPFEGYEVTDSVWPPYVMESACPIVGVVYDVIPYQDPVTYQPDRTYEEFFRARRDLLAQFEHYLAISDSAAREFASEFVVDPARVSTIGTGVASRYGRAIDGRRPREWLRLRQPAIVRPFVLCVGGPDERKNVEGLLAAYASVSSAVRTTHQLVVACHLEDDVRARWRGVAAAHGLAPDEVVLTGFVDDRTLVALYQAAELMVFPSRLEGFGLPVAEAIACGCPSITSNRSSLPEVIDWEPSTFDPDDTDQMATLTERALTDAPYRAELMAACDAAAPRHSWDHVAARTLAALETVRTRPIRRRPRRRIAVVGAYPPADTADAEANAALVAALARHDGLLVDVFVDGEVAPPAIGTPERRFPIAAYGRHLNPAQYDMRLYSLADRAGLSRTYRAALHHRGVVWLHDVGLGRVVLADVEDPWVVLRDQYGARTHSALRLIARPTPERLARAGIRLLGDVVDRSERVLVHTAVAAQLVMLDVASLGHVTPIEPLPIVRAAMPAAVGPPGRDGVVVMDRARLDAATAETVLGAMALLECTRLHVAGAPVGDEVAAMVNAMGLVDRFVVSDEPVDWTTVAAVLDVSADIMTAPGRIARLALAAGRPVVTNLPTLAHLAGAGVVTVAGDATAEMLAAALESALADPPPSNPDLTWTMEQFADHLVATIAGSA
jgi:glycosyltransferase involved in cell wall biosynthesis